MEQPRSFGALLRHYRERAGLTQEALAEQAGLTPNAIGALERGTRRRPYPQTVRALTKALHLGPEQHDRLVRLARAEEQVASSESAAPDVSTTAANVAIQRIGPGRLPVAPNPLLGREIEYEEVLQALVDRRCRLVTVAGPGGAGKTRLAVEVATDLAARFPDGVAWVALAPVVAADHLPLTIAAALDVPLRSTERPDRQLLDFLGDRQLLLVLDNLEHLLEGTTFLATVLEQAPGVRLLVTSRERLRITGEWVIELQGLALPEAAAPFGMARMAAVRLFVERARQVEHRFDITSENESAVTRICRLLEGLPLGIELAAAWIGTLTPEEIADEIARNLDFLERADRNAVPRHRSLRAGFDHSWNLLSDAERDVFARLAVFRDGCGRAAAEAVAGASLPTLAALVDKSLVRHARDATGRSRYDLHEILRQYALAKLQADPGAEEDIRDRHCAYYARQLRERADALLSDKMQAAWTEVAPDLDNLRAAWAWAVHRRDHMAFAQMGHSMYVICESRGLVEEGVAWFRDAARALRAAIGAAPTIGEVSNPELVWTLGQILSLNGRSAAQAGRYGEARDLLREGYALLRQRGDLLLGSGTLTGLGYTNFVLGAYAEARAWFTQSVGLARAHGETFFQATGELMLALVAQAQGVDDALAHAQAGLDIWRSNGHPRGLAVGHWAESIVLLAQGALTDAEAAARESLRWATTIQDPWATGNALLQLGTTVLVQGDPARADDLVQQSTALLAQVGEPWSRGRALIGCGWVAEARGNAADAHAWFQHALTLARALQLDPVRLNAQYGLAYLMREDAPAAALAFLDQVIAHPATEQTTRSRARDLHRRLGTDASATTATRPHTAGIGHPETGETLTAREAEVLRLLTEGRSNQAIADELVVVVGTVKRHINSILGKLQARSRLEAVARARELGLV